MSGSRDRRVRDLLGDVLDVPADERRARLEALEADASVVDEVLQLLAGEDEDFLADPPWNRLPEDLEATEASPIRRGEAPGPESDPPSHPRWVGPYRIVRHLASGGMGDVYLAEQEQPVRRRLAVKLVRTALVPGLGDARFRAEQQAMARLSHANVAKLFDAGTSEQGFPYFAMEFVDGEPLTRFADAQRLTVEQRVRLLVEVCRGVEHAHRRGILHRDLKPGNVLVEDLEGRPTPRIIDFGIAKALEDPLTDRTLTIERLPVGTPAYMSPEALAAEGDLDTRTDVYSLGVLLFELLVGRRPGRSGDSSKRPARLLETGDPPRASTSFRDLPLDKQRREAEARGTTRRELAATLAGDLGWVTWTALAPDRDDRYGSVAALAADLEAWLEKRPVSVHPPSLAYGLRKLVQRNPALTLVSVLALVGTLTGLLGTTIGFVQARAEAERANQEARTANEVSDFLTELFEVADPYENQGETVTARELLDQGAERIRTELDAVPHTQARLMNVMGRAYVSLGLLDPAEDLVRSALEQARGLDGARLDEASILDDLGYLLYKRNANDDAAEVLEKALRMRRELLGSEHELTARTLARLGDVEEQRGRLEAAARYLDEALRIQQKTLGPDHLAVAETLSRQSLVTSRQGNFDQALALSRQSLEILEAALGPVHLEVADGLNMLGGAQMRSGDPAAAAISSRRSLEIREEVLGPEHPDVGQSLTNLAITSDDFDVAVPLLERALGIWETSLGPDHPRIARLLANTAYYYLEERRLSEAEPLLERAYSIAVRPDLDPRGRVEYLGTLGKIDMDLGRWERAEERLRGALRYAEEGSVPDDDWGAKEALRKLAQLLQETGRSEEAKTYIERWEAATGETYVREDLAEETVVEAS